MPINIIVSLVDFSLFTGGILVYGLSGHSERVDG